MLFRGVMTYTPCTGQGCNRDSFSRLLPIDEGIGLVRVYIPVHPIQNEMCGFRADATPFFLRVSARTLNVLVDSWRSPTNTPVGEHAAGGRHVTARGTYVLALRRQQPQDKIVRVLDAPGV